MKDKLPTLAELRKRKRNGEKLSRAENFRLLASKTAKKYHRTGWSSAERKVKKILDKMGFREKEDYWHDYKLHNAQQSQYYALDFYLPDLSLAIEVSPSIWHKNLGNVEEKDKRKKAWLYRMGIHTAVIDDALLGSRKGSKARLREAIEGILEEHDTYD